MTRGQRAGTLAVISGQLGCCPPELAAISRGLCSACGRLGRVLTCSRAWRVSDRSALIAAVYCADLTATGRRRLRLTQIVDLFESLRQGPRIRLAALLARSRSHADADLPDASAARSQRNHSSSGTRRYRLGVLPPPLSERLTRPSNCFVSMPIFYHCRLLCPHTIYSTLSSCPHTIYCLARYSYLNRVEARM